MICACLLGLFRQARVLSSRRYFMQNVNNKKAVSYNKWGYIFLIPFFVVFIIFQLIPLVSTFYYSFFEKYKNGLEWIENGYVGFANYKDILAKDVPKYLTNTGVMWIIGFIPQILVSLLLGAWFSDNRLKLRLAGFYKVVIYLPNLIMASAFAMLFFTLFSNVGPAHDILVILKII
jgi:multiple sugar transport system permease protein